MQFLHQHNSGNAKTSQAKQQPFFLYVAFNAPHYPLQAPEKDVKKYIGKYLGGWDKLRRDRFERQKALGLFPESTKLSPRPGDVPAWTSLTAEQKKHEDLMMATFAAMVDRVDQNIGRLLEHLRQQNQLENTLVFFLSDNGACPFQRSKRLSIDQQLKPWDPKSYWTYDKGWAHAGNTPFREYKQNQHEGGINTPFIVHWPAAISKKLNGKILRQPAHLVDIMPTLLEVGETQYPGTHQGQTVGPARGTSLVPLFSGNPLNRKDPLLFSFYGKNNALRLGDLKIVNINFGKFELYNIRQDRTELQDLGPDQPEKLAEMKSLLETKFKDVGWSIKSKSQARRQKKKSKSKK